MKKTFRDAAPSALIGVSNYFEVPIMLMLVKICLKTKGWFNPQIRRMQ